VILILIVAENLALVKQIHGLIESVVLFYYIKIHVYMSK